MIQGRSDFAGTLHLRLASRQVGVVQKNSPIIRVSGVSTITKNILSLRSSITTASVLGS